MEIGYKANAPYTIAQTFGQTVGRTVGDAYLPATDRKFSPNGFNMLNSYIGLVLTADCYRYHIR